MGVVSMEEGKKREKVIVVGAGPVGSLAALYAANRGKDVEIYELRGGMSERSFLSLAAFAVMLHVISYLWLLRECTWSITLGVTL